MKPAVGGMSHKELHGSGSALNVGGPGERTHSMHTPSGTSPSVSEGKAEPRSERSQRQSDDTAATTTDYMYRQENMGGATKEGAARAVNEKRYEMAQGGNSVSASRVKDTDEVIASSRGDAPGSEYTENESGEAVPTGSNMANPRR